MKKPQRAGQPEGGAAGCDTPGQGVAVPAALYAKAVGLWFGFMALAVLSGQVRRTALEPALGEHRAHQLETLVLCALVLFAIVLFVRVTGPSPRQAIRLGLLWLLLSVFFEFPFMHLAEGVEWDRLLADYDLRQGRLLLLVWLTEFLGPRAAVLISSRFVRNSP